MALIKHKFKSVMLLVVGFIFILLFNNNTFAESNELPFSVEPVLPKDQVDNVSSYISVKAKDEFKRELGFILTNKGKEEQKINVNVVDAYTSPNGVVQYVLEETDNSKISDAQYKLTNYLKGNGLIVLEPNETKAISLPIDVEGLTGTLLGGVSFKVFADSEEVSMDKQSFTINNEINMVVGVMIDFGGESENIDLVFGEPFVDPMPAYYAVRLPTTMKNASLQKFVVDYKILYKNRQIFKNEKEFSFAPKASTNIAFPWEHEEIKKNETYVIKGTFKYKDSQDIEREIPFEKEFKYEVKEGSNNIASVLRAPFEQGGFPVWLFIIAVLIVGVFGFLWYKKHKKELAEKEKLQERIKELIETEDEFAGEGIKLWDSSQPPNA